MDIFKLNKTISRLNQMVDNAMEGRPIESGFDESKVSALETKLSQFLMMNSTTKTQLSEEKAKINELISDISHQTKTPLANILLYAQLLSEGDLSEQDRSYVASLLEQAEKLNFLIASLIKASRLETGIITTSPKKNNLGPLINDVITQALPKAEEKHITIKVETKDSEAIFDAKWTREALYNIVDNAVKYTPADGRITVLVKEYQQFCCIEVIDTGIGIREEEQAPIFARFYRSPQVSSKEGVGIGLYLAREIILGQGGYIKVSSILNQGSTFSVFLPLAQ